MADVARHLVATWALAHPIWWRAPIWRCAARSRRPGERWDARRRRRRRASRRCRAASESPPC